jgi:hypothetical protein
MSVALATDKFPEKIEVRVFIAIFIPDIQHTQTIICIATGHIFYRHVVLNLLITL